MRRPGILTLLLALSVVLVLSRPASAMKCSQWTRLSDDQKSKAIARMIDDEGGMRAFDVRAKRLDEGRLLLVLSDLTEVLRMAISGRVYLIGGGQKQINPIHGADILMPRRIFSYY